MQYNELFKKALAFVLKWEGGFVNDPDDKGGATNKGITQSTYNRYRKRKGLQLQTVRYITQQEVEDIYFNDYWLKSGCEKMSKKFAVLCFDTAVNMGTGIVKATGMTRNEEFLKAAEYKFPEKYIEAKRAKYYEFAKYGNQKKFLNGWLNRLNAVAKFIQTI
ncbi:TPA: hypothetical protein CPT87_07200 [Candidatus Gastranaerophilales bacterium HUM_5]|jgi:lysozyme family protein|nr:MAG TPA: hypothetical protein CPT99_09865 [Candidatus Gastranaerophilales bacterium HUM_4]DAA90995.1 MAG TPA: hypothetical protein CPT87_07200 [Candidatus Gastranaerophilales bacterium HUM_5]